MVIFRLYWLFYELFSIERAQIENLFCPSQDIEEKIRSFAQQGPRVVSILSANGSVSSVTLRQAGESGGTIRYEAWTLFDVHISFSLANFFIRILI